MNTLFSRALTCLSLSTLSIACAPSRPTQSGTTLESLRHQSHGTAGASEGQRDRALAELIAPGGNFEAGTRQLNSLRTSMPRDPRVRYALAALEFSHGDFEHSAADFAATIEMARTANDPLGGAMAEIAVGRLIAMRGDVVGFDRIFPAVIDGIVRDAGHLGAPAAVSIVETGVRWSRERGLHAEEQRWTQASGCVTQWTVAGAFGPHAMLRFDERLPPESPGPLQHDYDVGPGRGRRPTWQIHARGCAANLGRGRGEGGVFVAATDAVIARDVDAILHVESPNGFTVLLDGTPVGTLDTRDRDTGTSINVPLGLVAGRHTLRVKVASRFPSPLLFATLTDRSGHPIANFVDPTASANETAPVVQRDETSLTRLPDIRDPFSRFIVAELASTRRDPIAAREAMRPLATGAHPTPMTLRAWGAIALQDPFTPTNTQHDTARRAFEAAKIADPSAFYPYLVLARLAGSDNRADDALEMSRVAYERFPDNPEVQSERADRLMDRNWDGEATDVLHRAEHQLPGVCWPLRMLLSIAQRHGDAINERGVSEQIAHCDALADAQALTEVRARHWDAARLEFERLIVSDPEGRGLRRAVVDIARQRGALADAARGAEHILDENPEDTSLREDLVDMQLALGEPNQAMLLLDHEIARAPSQMWELYRYRSALERRESLTPWRLDGNQVLHRFESSGHHYDAAAVLVLDYTVRRQMPDGSALELTHNIVRLQTQEGVDEHATFNPPEGAMILTLRTHKADGRVLEPDAIARLDAIAFPDVHIGDAIEFEYIRSLPPADTSPSGFITDRFYFRGFDIPYDHSELVVVVPENMANSIVIDPRGPAPETQRRDIHGALVEYRWFVNQSQRMVPEPRSVAAREFIPSIALGASATWEHFVDALRDRLADQDPYDPEAARQAREIVGTARLPSEQLSRLHRWVVEHIDQQGGGTPFALAPTMLAGHSGHRPRVLCYLLKLQGIQCQMALVRQGNGDATPTELAEDDLFPSVLLRVRTEQGDRWVSASDRGAPVTWLPPSLAGQPAIVLERGAPRVTVTPLDPAAHSHEINVHLTLARDGSGRVDVVERLRGTWAVTWREQLRTIDQANLEHEFESYVGHEVTAASLVSLHIEGQDDPNADIVLRYTFTAPSIATAMGNGLAFEGMYHPEMGSAYAQLQRRNTTMYNGEPLNSTLIVDVTPPEGARIAELPHDASGTSPSLHWNVRFERTQQGFRLSRTIQVPIGRVTSQEYAHFADQMRALDTADTQRVAITVN